jgi:hypothetical protein
MRKDLEERNNALYAKLVPSMGNAGTMEGEILRAINKIVYRYYNDGDRYFEGYGCETAGPCHAFLVDETPIGNSLKVIFGFAEFSPNSELYEQTLDLALEKVLDFIESKNGKYEVSDVDMYNSESHFEEEEEEETCWECDKEYSWCECDED